MKVDFSKLRNRNIKICGKELYKEFSVLIPIVERKGDYYLLYEIRSENLSQQPNEICFPGGKIEADEDHVKAAIRETSEELLLPEDKIQLLGELDTMVTPFNTILYPFAGRLYDHNNTYNYDEVKEIFYVPLSYLMQTEPLCHYINIDMKPDEGFPYELIQEGRSYPWRKGRYPVYFYIYEGKVIWGITARITYNFVELLKE